jgi:hypothetical protein
LKPKEIRKDSTGRRRHFDLRQSLNYLKVKTTGRNPAGAKFAIIGVGSAVRAAKQV